MDPREMTRNVFKGLCVGIVIVAWFMRENWKLSEYPGIEKMRKEIMVHTLKTIL